MSRFVVRSAVPIVLAGGRPAAPGETVNAPERSERQLIDAGVLVPAPTETTHQHKRSDDEKES